MFRTARFLLTLTMVSMTIIAGCVSPTADTEQKADAADLIGLKMADVRSLASKLGDNASGVLDGAYEAASFLVGHDAGEPTLGITKEGVLFYAASTFKNDIAGQGIPLPRTDILRSRDHGMTWEDVTPMLPGGAVRTHPETGDPYVYVDQSTGRVFDIDQRVGVTCYTVTFSDDEGDSWFADFPACLTPPADHQTIVAAKPRLLTTAGYPNIVYVCYNQIATSMCLRSLNGGMSFLPTGAVGTKGVQPENFDPTFENPDFLCSAVVGHLKAAPDGTVYLPRRECEKPMVGITRDDGTTWELVKVSDVNAYNGGGVVGMDPAVAVDNDGNVYYVWQGADGHMYLSTSTDAGQTWSEAVDILAPGLTVANLATIAAGDAGKIAIAFVASSVEGGYNAEKDVMEVAAWDAYLVTIMDALNPDATIVTTRINPDDDPLVRGPCGPGRCNNPGLTDFIDIVIDFDGRPWVALVDNCIEKCAGPEGTAKDSTAAAGFVATLARGMRLIGEGPLPELMHGDDGHAHS